MSQVDETIDNRRWTMAAVYRLSSIVRSRNALAMQCTWNI
jgi:hypothetical protein